MKLNDETIKFLNYFTPSSLSVYLGISRQAVYSQLNGNSGQRGMVRMEHLLKYGKLLGMTCCSMCCRCDGNEVAELDYDRVNDALESVGVYTGKLNVNDYLISGVTARRG